jgi:lipoprotein-anchoring transpeptidase ErfK/SrfK
MHSLKNTIIAVGLLGLSFLFYQASSTNNSGPTDLIPALEISEGVKESGHMAEGDVESAQAGFNTMPNVELPDLRKPDLGQSTLPGSDFASPSADNSEKNHSTQMTPNKQNGGEFAVNPFPGASSASDATNQRDTGFPGLPFDDPTASSSNSGFTETTPPTSNSSNLDSSSVPPSVQRQPLDNVARDEGLINVLEKQNWQSKNFVTAKADRPDPNPAGVATEKPPFASQPIPATDSSFNRMATDRNSGDSGQFDPGVIQASSEPGFASLTYDAAWPQVDKFVAQEDYQSALRLLSRYYRSKDLTGPQRQRLIGWLDALAGKVIFSAEHHLQPTPYTVANESLDDIGQRWNVPAQLIFNINRANIPVVSAIAPGTQLKAVQGPFDAEIDLNQKVMTLFLGDLYAGRYPVQIGISGSPRPGEFQVLVKSETGHSWRDSEGKEYAPGTPENGYGPHWIGLSGSLCIHAVPDTATDGHYGCIGLNEGDAKDVFAILAKGSTVKIFR